ncbi:MAG: cobalt-precorrin-5B (C(1))-methyltransferase [Bilophila wadsworthia]
MGGISLLGTTGLVRPYSHEAYIHTVRICVKSHFLSGGSTMVFCTGGRTKSGAELHLPQLPATAFVSIGDFIAESLAAACRYGMREIAVACMPGKLCKYAAGFENTHAHKVSQDMDLLRAEVRRTLPAETGLHGALKYSASVREALLSIPDARDGLLAALRGPPSGNSRAAARVTRPSACSCSILKESSSLKKRGEGPKRPLPGSPQPSRRNRTNT